MKIFKSSACIRILKTKISNSHDFNQEHFFLPLSQYASSEDICLLKSFFDGISDNKFLNLYPSNQELILFLYKDEEDKFSLNISLRKISDAIIKNIFVIGRCVYETQSFSKILKNISLEELSMQIIDCGISQLV